MRLIGMARGRLRHKRPFSPTSTAKHWQTRIDNAAPWRSCRRFRSFQTFREQKEIPPEQHVAFGKRFGPLHAHPAVPTMAGHPEIFEIHATKDTKIANGEFWHSNVSYEQTLRLVELTPAQTQSQGHQSPP